MCVHTAMKYDVIAYLSTNTRGRCDKRVERDRGRVRKTVASINRARYAPRARDNEQKDIFRDEASASGP